MSNGTSNESYTLDSVGNRKASYRSASYTYQPNNELTGTATPLNKYDADGNMTSRSEGSTFMRFGWDFENRMTQASTRKQMVRYKYDALGRRVQRVTAGSKENTKFIFDGDDVVMDDDANSGITKYQNGLGIDDKLKLVNGGTSKYFLACIMRARHKVPILFVVGYLALLILLFLNSGAGHDWGTGAYVISTFPLGLISLALDYSFPHHDLILMLPFLGFVQYCLIGYFVGRWIEKRQTTE